MSILKRVDFGNEAGDDADESEITSYFVEQEDFGKFLKSSHKILVATAKKGVGKSELLQWAAQKLSKDESALVIKCRGADLVRSKFRLSSSLITPNDHIQDRMIRICASVNRRIAQELKVAINDDAITLVETAEIEGYRSRNLLGCLLDRFTRIFGDRQPQKLQISSELEVLKRRRLKDIWFIVDDLDATYQNTNAESLELATFFSACRYLSQDLQGIYFRVSMRVDVWALIRRYDESLDKMEQYVFEILWSQDDFLRLLALRIEAHANTARSTLTTRSTTSWRHWEELIWLIFVPEMEWGDHQQATYKVIYTLAYERPRWGIQLCKLARKSALKGNRERIAKDDIDNVWGEYGAKRIADLVAEHKHQCPEIEELLNGFRGADRLMSRDQLFGWINNRILNHMNPWIEGEMTRKPMQVARFLYRLGFILARSDSDKGYEHYRFDQMPDFLHSRTDDDFGLSWEIHPCYREALDIRKIDRSHRGRFSELRRPKSPR